MPWNALRGGTTRRHGRNKTTSQQNHSRNKPRSQRKHGRYRVARLADHADSPGRRPPAQAPGGGELARRKLPAVTAPGRAAAPVGPAGPASPAGEAALPAAWLLTLTQVARLARMARLAGNGGGIVRRLIVHRPAALDPAGDGPMAATGWPDRPGRPAVTWLPGHDDPAGSPRVSAAAASRIGPPVGQPRFVHPYTGTHIR